MLMIVFSRRVYQYPLSRTLGLAIYEIFIHHVHLFIPRPLYLRTFLR